MYPMTYYENFMRYEASDQVFVAMPFSKPFQHAFDTVIAPAIAAVLLNGKPFLEPRIINRGTTGSPDIHEQIFDAIIHSRLVIADMTVQSSCPADDGGVRWQANANVAYEVGLACAWRNPEDILLIHHPPVQLDLVVERAEDRGDGMLRWKRRNRDFNLANITNRKLWLRTFGGKCRNLLFKKRRAHELKKKTG